MTKYTVHKVFFGFWGEAPTTTCNTEGVAKKTRLLAFGNTFGVAGQGWGFAPKPRQKKLKLLCGHCT